MRLLSIILLIIYFLFFKDSSPFLSVFLDSPALFPDIPYLLTDENPSAAKDNFMVLMLVVMLISIVYTLGNPRRRKEGEKGAKRIENMENQMKEREGVRNVRELEVKAKRAAEIFSRTPPPQT